MTRYKVYVDTGEALWSTNGLTFDTPEKAKEYGSDLQWRWTMVRKFAVVKIPEDFAGEWVSYLTPEQISRAALGILNVRCRRGTGTEGLSSA